MGEKEERVVSPNSEQYQTAEEQSIEAPRRRRRVKKEEEREGELGEGEEGSVRRRRHRPTEEENGHEEEEDGQAPASSIDPDELRLKRMERRRSQKSQMRANVSEQSVVLDSGARVPESEVDAGLMGALMSTAADMGMGTLRRNKERRRSTKHRESSRKSGDLMRSRTRENNVYVEDEQ